MIFITVVGAVFSVIKAFLGNFLPLGIFLAFFVLDLIFFVMSLVKKEFLSEFFVRFGIRNLKIFCLVILITALLSSGVTVANFLKSNHRDLENGTYVVTADVKEVVEYDGSTKLLLGNVNVEGNRYNFNIQANVSGKDFAVGDRLTFTSYFYATKLVTNASINTSILKTNLSYYCTIDLETLSKSEGSASFTDLLKDKTKTILLENMDEENAGFGYAVICGDKSLLSSEYNEIFKNGGLAHLLAVSGLHIGFLVAVVLFVLKMCKVKNKYQFFVVLGVLLIYNILCNFSPSVFRASVMSLCLMLGMILGKRNDTLSNIGLAGVIVLTFQPLFLFDVGFLLSFGSVLGIILFTKTFSNIFEKIKLPKFIAESLAVTIGATIGTIPWICKYFHIFAPISFLSNLIVLPLFSIMFMILLLCVAINLIFSLPSLIVFAEFFVNIVVSFSKLFAKFGVVDTITFSTLSVAVYYIMAFFASPYFMLKTKPKLIVVLSIFICFSCLLANSNVNETIRINQVVATSNATKTLFFTTKSGKTMLSNIDGNQYHLKETREMLTQKRIFHIDYLLLFNYYDSYQNNVTTFAKEYDVKDIYVFGEYENSTKLGLVNNVYSSNIVHFVDDTNLVLNDCGFVIESLYEDYTKVVSYTIDDSSVLQILYSVSKSSIQSNAIFQKEFSCVVADSFYDVFFNIQSKQYVCHKAYNKTGKINLIESDELWTLEV